MKDKVLKLTDNIKIYVIDEMNYKDKKYIFAFEVTDNDDLIEDKPYILEVVITNDNLTLNEIEDFETASIVNNLFLARMANGE